MKCTNSDAHVNLVRAPACPQLDARDAALLKVRRLLVWLVHRHIDNRADAEDIVQDACVYFLRKYDPNRGKPETFARQCVRHALGLHRKRLRVRARHTARYHVEKRPTPAAPVHADEYTKLRAAVDALTPTVRRTLVARFGLDGSEPKELAAIAGAVETKQAVHQRVKTGLRKVALALGA